MTTVSAEHVLAHRAVAHRVGAAGARRAPCRRCEASAPGSIGKNRPVSLDLVVELLARARPACTVTVRSSALHARAPRSCAPRSMLMPPCTASRWPSSDEPTPNGITGTAWRRPACTTSATSSVLSQNTTASGGGTSNGDSSRPCCSRTASAVEQRSPKRAFKRVDHRRRHRARLELGQQVGGQRRVHGMTPAVRRPRQRISAGATRCTAANRQPLLAWPHGAIA